MLMSTVGISMPLPRIALQLLAAISPRAREPGLKDKGYTTVRYLQYARVSGQKFFLRYQ
jgi:hypothetical protein